jgi:hypothetical protein
MAGARDVETSPVGAFVLAKRVMSHPRLSHDSLSWNPM